MSDDSYGMQALGPSGSADKKDWLIGSATSLEDIVSALSEHGCCNLTSFIDPAMCSENAIAGGGFCDVYRGELNDGTKVAIKVLRVYDKPGEADSKQKILKRAAREIYYWSRLKHRNVLPLMGLAIFRGHMSMISGWMDYGDLRSYVKVHPRADCISLCIDVCVGLCYIHKKEMAHGDLKAANVMVSPSGVAMLADFGNSQLKDLTIRFTNTTYRGRSIRWTAPELLQEDNGLDVSKEADVYAFGMTALETLTGKVPYEELTEQKLLFMIASRYKHPARPAAITSDELWDLLAQCWAKEPSRRPTMKDVRRQLQGLSTSTTGGQNTANGAVPNPPLPRLHQLPPVLVQEQMPLYAQGNLNRLVQHRGPAVSMYTVASEPTAQKAKLGEGGMISNRPVLNKDTSLSSAKVDSNKGGWTNYSLREPGQLWIHLVPQEVADRVSDQERRRQEAINEVIYTERDFVRDLEYLRDRWMQPLRTEDVIPPERRLDFVQQVFWNIEDIIGVSTRLRDLLTQRQNADPIVETIGDVFSELVPHFQPFVQYGRHQLYGKYESEKERMTNPAFASFAEAVEQSSESRKLELNGYLTKPTTRLARYPLLLEVVLKHTPEDNPDRAAIPKVVKIVREFLGRVNEESGKTENRFNLLELDRRLLFNPGEEVDLKLGDEQRQLVYKGPLKGREGALNRGRDFQVFLFDHALLVVKSKVVDKQKRLKVFRRPIPLELLAVSISEANAPQSSKAHKAFIGRYLNDSTHGAPSPSAPARGDSQKTGYQLIISHIGKKGYSLALWASTFVARRKWLEHIMAQQGVMRERSKVFDTFLLSQDVFVGPPKVNCSVPYDYSRRIAYGTDVGVYFQSLYGQDSTPVKGIELAGVTQIDVLEDYQLLVVLSGRSVLTFPFNVLDFADPMEQMKQISMRTSYFKVGYCLGRTLVCVVEASSVSSTIKVLEPVGQFIYEKNEPMLKKLQQDENGALGVFREFHIPTESYSIHFLKTKLFVVCTKGFEVFDLETMNKQSLFHPADASLDLLQKREDARPLAIYKIDEEYLICYTEFAFYVSMSGWRSKRDVTIYWEGSPTAFVLHYPHVMAFDPAFVEIRHVSDGSLVQVIHGNNLRLLFADTRSSVVNSASIGGGPITLRSDRNRSMGAHTRPQQRQPRTHERDEIIIASRDKVMAVWRAPQSPRASDVSAPAA